MGKLNIAHHKSYHPYRRDNIERVRRDEEEARMKEEQEEGRMMVAVSNAIHKFIRRLWGLGAYPDRFSLGLRGKITASERSCVQFQK